MYGHLPVPEAVCRSAANKLHIWCPCTVITSVDSRSACWISCKIFPVLVVRNCSQCLPLIFVRCTRCVSVTSYALPALAVPKTFPKHTNICEVACQIFALHNTLSVNRVGDSPLRLTRLSG